MADISSIRAAIASRLSTLLGSSGNSYSYWESQPSTPSMQIVGFGPGDYDSTFGRGSDVLTCTVQALASPGLDEAAQRQIDDWLDTSGSTSVKAAIETERPAAVTLGGLVSSCQVTGHSRPVITQLPNGQDVWSVEFSLTIHT